MKTSKQILKVANIYPRLRLFEKTERGLKSTGKHIVKLILDKEVKGTEFKTGKEVEKVRYLVEENGEKKIFERNKFNKSGDVDYLVIKLAEYNEGSEVVIEGVKAGMKNVVNLSSLVGGESVEVEDEHEEDGVVEDYEETNESDISI
jgi:hypothetical protein